MSFSVIVKNEVMKQETTKLEIISFLSAYLRNNAVITENSIIINSENESVASYIFKLIKDAI
jgi:DNA-binding transcriptional regulator WhiA